MTFLFCFKEQKRHCHKYRILVSWFNLSQKIQKMENITAQFATFSRTWQARVLKTTSRPFTFHQAFHISVHCVHWHLTAKSNWIIIKPLNTNKKWIPNFLLLCICLIWFFRFNHWPKSIAPIREKRWKRWPFLLHNLWRLFSYNKTLD